MIENGQRDFVGYGRHLPDAKWPGGARLALNFVVNFEEGSEPSIMDGDGKTESPPGRPSPVAAGRRDLAAESMFEYGSRVGFWRLYRLFREHGLPFTLFGCALALERNPEAASAIVEAGFDVCCHGWRWIQHFHLSETEERLQIAKAIESLRKTVGERPLGWYCRYGAGENTRRLIVEEGGFLYDSDSYCDEIPYWLKVGGKTHLVVPYSLTTNDSQVAHGVLGTGDEFFEFMRDTFDVLYAEGEVSPRMMSVGLHMRVSGHPGRASGLARFLDYVQKKEKVWVCGRLDIAKHWHAHHKPTEA
jgi:allantoinase